MAMWRQLYKWAYGYTYDSVIIMRKFGKISLVIHQWGEFSAIYMFTGLNNDCTLFMLGSYMDQDIPLSLYMMTYYIWIWNSIKLILTLLEYEVFD